MFVEFDDASGYGGIDGRADVAAPRSGGAVGMKGDEGFVDRAVVAPVEDENLRAAGDLACQADGKAVGVSGGERELPVG